MIPIKKVSKVKVEVIKKPQDKITHNIMLAKAMMYVGTLSPMYEILGKTPTLRQHVLQS